MFPPWGLFFVFLRLMLGLPLGILPLPFPALKRGLYLREQDTGQSLDLMGRDAAGHYRAGMRSARNCFML